MNSFVDNFIDKRVSIETLLELLKVNYQREILSEMIVGDYSSENIKMKILNPFLLKMQSDKYCFFILLSKDRGTLKKVKVQIEKLKTNKIIYSVYFDQSIKNENLINPTYINPKDWMNRIISNGINTRILHLQYMRDMTFHYE
tara:strand:- start:59 stop:487 length:429 start_codon:yes stop_codon:yes gene_type:complete